MPVLFLAQKIDFSFPLLFWFLHEHIDPIVDPPSHIASNGFSQSTTSRVVTPVQTDFPEEKRMGGKNKYR